MTIEIEQRAEKMPRNWKYNLWKKYHCVAYSSENFHGLIQIVYRKQFYKALTEAVRLQEELLKKENSTK